MTDKHTSEEKICRRCSGTEFEPGGAGPCKVYPPGPDEITGGHMPEPWKKYDTPVRFGSAAIIPKRDACVSVTLLLGSYNRAATCVNACAGIPFPLTDINGRRELQDFLNNYWCNACGAEQTPERWCQCENDE